MSNAAEEYQVAQMKAHLAAREIAVEVFGPLVKPESPKDYKPSFQIINAVYERCIYVDEESGDVIEDSTRDAAQDLSMAVTWAQEVYGDASPEAVLAAYDAAFDLDSEE